MANTYYDESQRAKRVQALFDRIASRYDLINDLQSFGLHRSWKRRLIKLAEVKPGSTALDTCCGTGDLTFALGAAGAKTIGLDFTAAMLGQAERRLGSGDRALRDSVRFVQGDAQNLPFPDASFEVVTVGYGLRNLTDWKRGLQEMVRVTRTGGRVLVLDFGKPDNPVWRSLYFSYLRVFVPVLGKVFCGSWSAYSYILESLQHYPAQHGVSAEMEILALREVRIVNLLGGIMTINIGKKG